ncbi:hypothetical protein F5Y16DRAFT_217875 [Xylariaceae sp. FL0255]|nr:hypothetical protein F5Y16DRAFT_217875 [Xylariaceae sp. FL0255]
MKATFTAFVSLLTAGALAAPINNSDSFNYHNNINNAAAVVDARAGGPNSDLLNYHNNINNASTAKDVEEKETLGLENDLFNYTNNIDNASDVKELNDEFNYHNNIDNAVAVTDADGTKVILSSPYSDDVNTADPKSILGE